MFTNQINNKKYIGQTTDEKHRYNQHKNCYEDSVFHRAIQKYDFENFTYTHLFESDNIEELNQKEQEYIILYNSLAPNGYNVDSGGRNNWHGPHTEDSKVLMSKAKGKLTEEEVIMLRKAYLNNGHPVTLYNEFFSKRIGSLQAFMNIWCGKRYKHIMPEVFEQRKNKHTKINKDIAHQIKELSKDKTLTRRAIAEMFNVSVSTIADIRAGKTWKDA